MTEIIKLTGEAFLQASRPRPMHPCPFSLCLRVPTLKLLPSDTSITDLWGRALSYHFLNQTTSNNFYTNSTGHGAGQLWSQTPLLPSYANRSIPFPIIAADSIPSASTPTSAVSLESVVYEASARILPLFSPWAHGSSLHHSSLGPGIQAYLLWLQWPILARTS